MSSGQGAEPDKLYYRIGEVSEMLGVNSSLIRFWEKEFPNLKLKKDTKGNRVFGHKDIETLKYIHFLVKEQGHTLEGAKKLIRQKDLEDARTYRLIQRLEDLKSFLVKLREEI